MNEKPESPPDAPDAAAALAAANGPAPFIFASIASCWGHSDGVAEITLMARRLLNGPEGSTRPDFVAVAHLRMSLPAMLQLRDVIDRIEEMARASSARPMN
jgi:hypothetical protein